MRVVFFGTPQFAASSLSRLLEAGIEVPLVVTQPDRPAGRHATPLPSAVARLAAIRGIPTAKPEKLRGNLEVVGRLKEARPDAGIVVAYGRILPAEILALPPHGFVNVHASLLPRHRGASPVAAAILAGDQETGVTTMRVEEEVDAGPVYLSRPLAIEPRENAGSLSARLAGAGAELLIETMRALETGRVIPQPQRGEPSFCRPIRREDGAVDWRQPASEIERSLRAFTPWPGIHGFFAGQRVKILAAEPGPPLEEAPGTLVRVDDRLLVAAGEGTSLALDRVQRAGRKPTTAAEFARGLAAGARFDPPSARPRR